MGIPNNHSNPARAISVSSVPIALQRVNLGKVPDKISIGSLAVVSWPVSDSLGAVATEQVRPQL